MESCLITPPSITAKYWRLRTNYHTSLAGANGSFYDRNGEYGLYDTYQFNTLPEGSTITSHPNQLNTDTITSDNSSLTGQLTNIYNGIYKEQLAGSLTTHKLGILPLRLRILLKLSNY